MEIGIDFFVDTNVLIYAMEGQRRVADILRCSPGISVISEVELLGKQKYSVKTPDAIIAATAKAFNLPLVTADKDFKKIKDIEVVLLD